MGIDYNAFAQSSNFDPLARKLESRGEANAAFWERANNAASRPRIIHNLMRLSSNGSSSSGSECQPDSLCLAEMVNEFLEDGFGDSKDTKPGSGASCSYNPSPRKNLRNDFDVEYPFNSLKVLVEHSDPLEAKLLNQVSSIVESYAESSVSICSSGVENCSGSCLRRFVMSRLRASGYNAALCKSRWPHARNSPGGEYEYIDVLFEGKGQRLIVDIDFAGQFQITRPTAQYLSVLEIVPTIFVGRASRLLQIVDIMTDEAKNSLKSRDMHLPPWRKLEYMRLKWLSQYRRTTNDSVKSADYQCRKPDVIVNQIGDKGTETSPILLEVQALNDDPLHYGGKLFCLKENCLRGNKAACECNKNGGNALRREASTISVLDNLQWKLPTVDSTPKVRAGLSACFKQSELAKQLKGLSKV